MSNEEVSQTSPAARWVRIPNGTKVRHRHKGYDGHIDGLTEIEVGPNRNPDGKTQYRLDIGGSSRELVTEDDLSILVDGANLVIMIRQKEPYRRSITAQLHGVRAEDRFIKAGRSSAVPATARAHRSLRHAGYRRDAVVGRARPGTPRAAAMSYAVKEVFYTLQGEGANASRAAVFCRFAGCNLWSGREQHRARAVCRLCDTDFVGMDGPGGGRFANAAALAAAIAAQWRAAADRAARPMVVFTGGEPLLRKNIEILIEELARLRTPGGKPVEITLTTNGTLLRKKSKILKEATARVA